MGNDWKITSLLKACNQKLNSGINRKKYKVYRKYGKYQGGGRGWQRRQWHPTPVLLPGKSHGQRSLVGCSPQGRQSRTRLSNFPFTFHFSLSFIGEGNGNPLQCSCLGNPWDVGAWQAAVYGVAQSRTRLKQLSRSKAL